MAEPFWPTDETERKTDFSKYARERRQAAAIVNAAIVFIFLVALKYKAKNRVSLAFVGVTRASYVSHSLLHRLQCGILFSHEHEPNPPKNENDF